MNESRVIKKYPNRRLYDTAVSSYITLDDIKRLVVEQVNVKIIDTRTNEDITHSTLLQIIIEQEEKGPSLFTTSSLQQMIRFYDGSMQEMLKILIEQSVAFFNEQQHIFHKDLKKDQLELITEMASQNFQHWQQLQHQWLQNWNEKFKR